MEIVQSLVLTVIILPIVSFLGALILQLSSKIVIKYKPTYWKSYKALVLSGYACILISIIFLLITIFSLAAAPKFLHDAILLLVFVTALFATIYIGILLFSKILKDSEGKTINKTEAAKIFLIQQIIHSLPYLLFI